jgi:hypothetical protein
VEDCRNEGRTRFRLGAKPIEPNPPRLSGSHDAAFTCVAVLEFERIARRGAAPRRPPRPILEGAMRQLLRTKTEGALKGPEIEGLAQENAATIRSRGHSRCRQRVPDHPAVLRLADALTNVAGSRIRACEGCLNTGTASQCNASASCGKVDPVFRTERCAA